MTSAVLIQLTVLGLHMLSALQVGPMNIIQDAYLNLSTYQERRMD